MHWQSGTNLPWSCEEEGRAARACARLVVGPGEARVVHPSLLLPRLEVKFLLHTCKPQGGKSGMRVGFKAALCCRYCANAENAGNVPSWAVPSRLQAGKPARPAFLRTWPPTFLPRPDAVRLGPLAGLHTTV